MSIKNFWRNIIGCTYNLILLLSYITNLRQSEINQFKLSILCKHNIFRFDISMDNPLTVHMIASTEQFFHIICSYFLAKYIIILLGYLLEKLSSADVFHHKINIFIIIICLIIFDNIRMV